MCTIFRCGAHICWVCVRAFPNSESTYAHMGTAHGGIYDNDAAPAANVDLNEQREVLRQAERLRLQRQAREGLVRNRAVPQEREQHDQPNRNGHVDDVLREYNAMVLRARALQEETRRQERVQELREREQQAHAARIAEARREQEARRRREEGGWCLVM